VGFCARQRAELIPPTVSCLESPPSVSAFLEVTAMLVIPGRSGKDTCDGITRRDVLRIGGSAALGLSLADIFALQ